MCEHRNARLLVCAGDKIRVGAAWAASGDLVPHFPVWCEDCGAIRDSTGRWYLPNPPVQVHVAPPSPHRIQSTGDDRPVFPEFLPPAH